MQSWSLKIRILETMYFPPKHTTTNISDSLLNARIDFDVWPKSVEGRIPQSEEALRSDKIARFAIKPPLSRPVLTIDCRSDVLAGAEKDHLSGCNCCAYPYLSIAVQAARKINAIEKSFFRLSLQLHYRKSMGLVG